MRLPNAEATARFGQILFALAIIAFATITFAVGDFVAGRAPVWPAGMPGRLVWAYLSCVVLLAAGVRMLRGRHGARAAFVVAVLVFAWALLRNIPAAAAEGMLGAAWTMLGKSLALSGGALGVAASLLGTRGAEAGLDPRRAPLLDLIGRCSLGAFLVLGGVQHFLFPQFVATLVPTWIPGALFWTYFAAVALIAGGIGLVIPQTARLAAFFVGVMIFSWFWVLHMPRAIAGNNQNEWTAVFEALAFAGIAFALARRPAAEPM